MGFYIKYTDASGTHETELNPYPSDVDYPEADALSVQTSEDGTPIFQRPVRDGRVRKWIFGGWGKSSEPYATQWALLQSLTGKNRGIAGLERHVYIWEDVSGVGGFDRTDGSGNKVYTRIKIAQANRVPRNGGGPLRYDSTLEFYIDDPSYTAF